MSDVSPDRRIEKQRNQLRYTALTAIKPLPRTLELKCRLTYLFGLLSAAFATHCTEALTNMAHPHNSVPANTRKSTVIVHRRPAPIGVVMTLPS